MELTRRSTWLTTAVVIALGIAARTRLLVDPDIASLGWRSADLASVALNYYEHGFRFLYPETHWGGTTAAWVEMELPLVPYVAALLYAVFGVREWLGALLPYAAGVAAPVALFHLGRPALGDEAAALGAALMAVSPVLAGYSQGLMSDPPMVCLSVLGVLWFQRWLEDGRGWRLPASGFAIALAIGLKPTALVVGVPLLVLLWQKDGAAFWRRPALWAFGALCLVPPAAWYLHAHSLQAVTGNSFGVLSGGYSKMAHAGLLASPVFYSRLASRWVLYHLTPVWSLAAAAGFLHLLRAPASRFVIAWLVAGLAMLVAVAEGTHQMVYYHLPVLPPACLAAGAGIMLSWERVCALTEQRPAWHRGAATAVAALLLLSVVGSTLVYGRRADHVPFARALRAQALELRQVLRPGAPVVLVSADFSGGPVDGALPSIRLPRGAHMSPPELLYHSRHRGWYLAVAWTTIDELESARHRGADYLIVADYLGGEVEDFRTTRADVLRHAAERYRLVLDRKNLLVFDLRPADGTGGARHAGQAPRQG